MKDHKTENHRDKTKSSKSMMMKNKKRNQQRLGGGGLSLEAFANAKSRDSTYNPAIIKKQREFYKNAKWVKKFKKSLKQQNEVQKRPSLNTWISEEGDANKASSSTDKQNKRNNKHQSLEEIYKHKRQEEEKARLEREALLQAKKEAREKTEAQRKVAKEKMHKKTASGQPIMRYRIEHILQSIQDSKR